VTFPTSTLAAQRAPPADVERVEVLVELLADGQTDKTGQADQRTGHRTAPTVGELPDTAEQRGGQYRDGAGGMSGSNPFETVVVNGTLGAFTATCGVTITLDNPLSSLTD